MFPVVLFLALIALDFGRIYLGWVNLEQMTRIAANRAADHATAWATGDPAERARYQGQVSQDASLINCDPQDPIPDPVIAGGTALGAHVTVSITCSFTVLTPMISDILGGTVLVTAETTFPIKEGAVATVPGGGAPIETPPEATFEASPLSGWAPLSVALTDTSSGAPTSWIWDFEVGRSGTGVGKATPGNATLQGPHAVTYDCAGAPGDTCTFGVSLHVANPGGTDSIEKTDYITVTIPPITGPIAEFSASPSSGIEPVTTRFEFVDVREGALTYTDWEWDFTSNGSFDASGMTVTHTYTTTGSYDVTLRVTDETGAQNTLTKDDVVIVQHKVCTVPDFFNTKMGKAQDRWDEAGFTTQVLFQSGTGNYSIGYQSIVGGVIDPQPAGCGAVITVGP